MKIREDLIQRILKKKLLFFGYNHCAEDATAGSFTVEKVSYFHVKRMIGLVNKFLFQMFSLTTFLYMRSAGDFYVKSSQIHSITSMFFFQVLFQVFKI